MNSATKINLTLLFFVFILTNILVNGLDAAKIKVTHIPKQNEIDIKDIILGFLGKNRITIDENIHEQNGIMNKCDVEANMNDKYAYPKIISAENKNNREYGYKINNEYRLKRGMCKNQRPHSKVLNETAVSNEDIPADFNTQNSHNLKLNDHQTLKNIEKHGTSSINRTNLNKYFSHKNSTGSKASDISLIFNRKSECPMNSIATTDNTDTSKKVTSFSKLNPIKSFYTTCLKPKAIKEDNQKFNGKEKETCIRNVCLVDKEHFGLNILSKITLQEHNTINESSTVNDVKSSTHIFVNNLKNVKKTKKFSFYDQDNALHNLSCTNKVQVNKKDENYESYTSQSQKRALTASSNDNYLQQFVRRYIRDSFDEFTKYGLKRIYNLCKTILDDLKLNITKTEREIIKERIQQTQEAEAEERSILLNRLYQQKNEISLISESLDQLREIELNAKLKQSDSLILLG